MAAPAAPTLLLLLLLPLTAAQPATEAAVLKRLKQLSARFGPDVLPITNISHPVLLRMELRPLQLVKVDSARENLFVSAMVILSWKDKLIVWNSSEFGGTNLVFMDHRLMWTPQLLINGAVGDEKQMLTVDCPLGVQSVSPTESRVTAVWVHEFRTACDFDMNRFPLDDQVCELPLSGTAFRQPLYGTETFASGLSTSAFTSMFTGNSEWKLVSFQFKNSTKEITMVTGEKYNISTATAVFKVRRYSTYFDIVSTVPLLLLTVLQLLIYLVPLESGEKTGCGVTILLSFTVFLLLIDQIVPKSQIVPVMVYFITISIVISAASLVYNCLLLRLYHTCSGTKMPKCVEQLLVQGLGCLMCLRCCQDREQNYEVSDSNCDTDNGSNKWQLAAAALERLGFVIHVACVAASIVWMQVRL